MNRKQFIESNGATCRNWKWIWSFVNHAAKFIIFGAWDIHDEGHKTLILSQDWETSRRGRKQPAYAQSREHIRLIEEEGYKLKTFPMTYSSTNEKDSCGPAKIGRFVPQLTEKILSRIGNSWYSSNVSTTSRITEELHPSELFIEGTSTNITVNTYERNLVARARCIEFHGYRCSVCSFDFEEFYGSIGKNYIHVHHVVPLAEIQNDMK